MLILNDNRRVYSLWECALDYHQRKGNVMWRRPVGRAGSGPGTRGDFRIQITDYDPQQLPGCKVVSGRVLSQEFLDQMAAAKAVAVPEVDFIAQMRERKLNGTSQGPTSSDWPKEPAYLHISSAEGS